MSKPAKPLEGIKVIEMGIHVAASSASSLLGYLGADVIKVETVKGDPYRIQGLTYGIPSTPKHNPQFDLVNPYKRGVSINQRTEEGREIMRKLLKSADIFMTNFRDSALANMGLSYEEVLAVNPKIVYATLDGYGKKGEEAGRAAYDLTAFFSRSGFISAAQYPTAAPMLGPNAAGDDTTSIAFALGILAAYMQVQKTGVGTRIDTSLMQTAMWVMMGATATTYLSKDKPQKMFDLEHPSWTALCTDYKCKDGVWVKFCCMSIEQYWSSVCHAFDLVDFIDDPRFNNMPGQMANAPEVYAMMKSKISQLSSAEVKARIKEWDLPAEIILTTWQCASSEQARVNGFVSPIPTYENYGMEDFVAAMPPFKIAGMEDEPRTRAPYLGEDTENVLSDLGYSREQLDKMLADGTISQFGKSEVNPAFANYKKAMGWTIEDK